MTFTKLDVDFQPTVLEETRRIMFGVPYERDGRLSLEEYRAIADQNWPYRLRSNLWDKWSDFA
jgi:hypothetical protein